jgi:hypothetical protein
MQSAKTIVFAAGGQQPCVRLVSVKFVAGKVGDRQFIEGKGAKKASKMRAEGKRIMLKMATW